MPYSFQSVYFDNRIVPGRVLDIFMPEKTTRETAVFFVHGGGWRGGSRVNYHKLMEACNKEGFSCAAPDYRLEGVNIFDQITDVRHGYDIFRKRLKSQGQTQKIFVHGSSAGAHLGALLVMAMPGECGEETAYGDYTLKDEWVRPAGASLQAMPVTFEPWEEIFPIIWRSMQNIIGAPYEKQPDLYRRVSPINYLSADTPPLFLLGAENEEMFPLEYNLDFIEKAGSFGSRVDYKVYTNAEHGFFYDVTRRQQKEALADIIAFIESL